MYKIISTLRERLLVYLTHQLALPLLKRIRKPQKFNYTAASLQQLPDGAVGKDLVRMLEQHQLQLLPYYVKHDIKHLLLGYGTTGEGEVCLQCFMLGNKHLSIPVIATVLFGLISMPEHWTSFYRAYQRGRRSVPIEGWPWFSLLELPTQSLIDRINAGKEQGMPGVF